MNALLQPSPNDANLRTSGDPLGMLREGSYDLNRFQYYPYRNNVNIWNRTDDIFNHTRSSGGYNNNGVTIYPDKVINMTQNAGGINPFPPKQNNILPVRNALVNEPVYPKISQLVDKPPPAQINPIAAT
jgi:hypothetical protein